MSRNIEARVEEAASVVSKESPLTIDSPPLIDLGYLPDDLHHQMMGLASKVLENPGYLEKGRLSRLIYLPNITPDFEDLAEFSNSIGDTFLKKKPGNGSSALISVVTDAEEFKRHTETDKAASRWHQDFDTTPTGFYFPPDSRTRLIIPLSVGTIYATGKLVFGDITQIDSEKEVNRSEALNTGPTVIGTDGVLIKSEVDPIGASIHIAEPGKVYIVPRRSVHKSPTLPTGRVFFQLDVFSKN